MHEIKIAYFSMEIGLNGGIPTYCGGLGVLAGDTLKSSADFKVHIVGVTLISRKGFLEQGFDEYGNQIDGEVIWKPEEYMERLDAKVKVGLGEKEIYVGAWKYEIEGITGHRVPIIFLDTDLAENREEDRKITDSLYGGDSEYRLKQEIILGIGGVRMLKELGYNIHKYHMNEGHSSLLALELLKNRLEENRYPDEAEMDVRHMCIFTTHTPIPAGHDKFSYELVEKKLNKYMDIELIKKYGGPEHLNMTLLGFNLSEYINGVAKKHGEVSRSMFPGYTVYSITNGVHPPTWTCESFQGLYDRHIKDWRGDPFLFRYVIGIPDEEVWEAHSKAKKELLDWINQDLKEEKLTIGFARRMTEYKRPNLIFSDIERLRKINGIGKGIQLIFAGKAHPRDYKGKELIRRIKEYAAELGDELSVTYLEDYDIEVAKKLVSGVDLWLNTPKKPQEASGTSGMKATLNGVINFSVLDGWWIEGHIEEVTGWGIGEVEEQDEKECLDELYLKLERISKTYYEDKPRWIGIMKNAISLNASFFNSHRMIHQYVVNAYLD